MRVRVPRDDLEELARAVGIGRVVEQRFHISANRRERRPQLVRHVGDEVAPDLIGPAQIGDVVQDEHGAAAAGAGDGCGPGHERSARIARQRQLLAARPRRREARRVSCAAMSGCRITSRYGPAGGGRIDAQHVLRGAIHELQPPLPIDDEHAFDHAGEDGAHPRAIARQLLDPSAQLLHRGVERTGDRAELVGPVVVRGSRQVPGRIAIRDARDRLNAAASGADSSHETASAIGMATAIALSAARRIAAQLLVDVGQRQGQAHEPHHRMGCPNSDVQHVGIDGRAVALARADATLRGPRRPPGATHGSRACRASPQSSVESPTHTSVLGDQRDAARHQLAEAIGFVVEGRALEAWST